MRWIAPTVVALIAGAALLAGCGGSADPTDSSASAGGPAQASASAADGIYVNESVKQAISSPQALPACQGQRSDEHICGDFFNYLLAWVPSSTGGTPLLAGAEDATGKPSGSLLYLPAKGADGGNTVQAGHHNNEGDGKYWWGPCGDNWRKCVGPSHGAAFANRLLIEWSDDGANENSGSVYLNLQAGDVSLGQTWVAHFNDGQEGAGECRSADRQGWPAYVVCSADGKNHNASTRSEDVQDELGFGYWFRDFPVRIALRSKLPNSRVDITGITANDFKIAKASTLKAPSSISVGAGNDATRYLVGFRRFDAVDRGDEVIIRGTLRSIPPPADSTTTGTDTTPAAPPDKWDGSIITMRVRLGSDKVASTQGTTTTSSETKPVSQGSSCEIEMASSETSVHTPQCSVAGAVAPGRDGTLNDIQFFVR